MTGLDDTESDVNYDENSRTWKFTISFQSTLYFTHQFNTVSQTNSWTKSCSRITTSRKLFCAPHLMCAHNKNLGLTVKFILGFTVKNMWCAHQNSGMLILCERKEIVRFQVQMISLPFALQWFSSNSPLNRTNWKKSKNACINFWFTN